MKKLLLLFLMLCMFTGCADETRDWQTLEIPNIGTFCVPAEWQYRNSGETLLFLNEGTVVVFGIVCRNFEQNPFDALSEFLGKEIVFVACSESEVDSNSALLSRNQCLIDGEKREIHRLSLSNLMKENDRFVDYHLYLFVIDDTVSYDTLRSVGTTFSRECNE